MAHGWLSNKHELQLNDDDYNTYLAPAEELFSF